MKRFIVFTGRKDECQSGWDSIDSDHDTTEAAIERGVKLTGHRPEWDDPDYDGGFDENDDNYDIDIYLWVQIVDTETRKVIKEMGYEMP